MDKNEYLNLDNQKGSSMSFSLISEYDDQKKTWKTIGVGTFGASFDLVYWGIVEESAMAIDDDLMVSVAIVMKALSETVYDESFKERLLSSVNEQYKE